VSAKLMNVFATARDDNLAMRPFVTLIRTRVHVAGKLMLIVNAEQLVEELSQELDELRSFKAEFMSKSKSDLSSDFSQKHCRQLEALVTHLKQVTLALGVPFYLNLLNMYKSVSK